MTVLLGCWRVGWKTHRLIFRSSWNAQVKLEYEIVERFTFQMFLIVEQNQRLTEYKVFLQINIKKTSKKIKEGFTYKRLLFT